VFHENGLAGVTLFLYERYSDLRFCSTSLMKLRLILYFTRRASRWPTNSAPRSMRRITEAAFTSKPTEGSVATVLKGQQCGG
jgi:hypothetical protein